MAYQTERVVLNWSLGRYEYDGAPLLATRSTGDVTLEIDQFGDLLIDGVDHVSGVFMRSVPGEVLRALLADHDKRTPADIAATVDPPDSEPPGPGEGPKP